MSQMKTAAWLILGGSVAMGVLLMGGMVVLFGTFLVGRTQAARLPVIEVSPDVTAIRFGPWRKESAKNGLGIEGLYLFTEVTANDEQARSHEYRVEQFDDTGKKLHSGSMSFPALKPGERGDGWISLYADAAKITVKKR